MSEPPKRLAVRWRGLSRTQRAFVVMPAVAGVITLIVARHDMSFELVSILSGMSLLIAGLVLYGDEL